MHGSAAAGGILPPLNLSVRRLVLVLLPIPFPVIAGSRFERISAMWPYALLSIAVAASILGVMFLAKRWWGYHDEMLSGLIVSAGTVYLVIWVYYKRHLARPLPFERAVLLWVCFVPFWFLDEGLRIHVELGQGALSFKAWVVAVLASAIDFVLVWVWVRLVLAYLGSKYDGIANTAKAA